jgi:hypothetical protein
VAGEAVVAVAITAEEETLVNMAISKEDTTVVAVEEEAAAEAAAVVVAVAQCVETTTWEAAEAGQDLTLVVRLDDIRFLTAHNI